MMTESRKYLDVARFIELAVARFPEIRSRWFDSYFEEGLDDVQLGYDVMSDAVPVLVRQHQRLSEFFDMLDAVLDGVVDLSDVIGLGFVESLVNYASNVGVDLTYLIDQPPLGKGRHLLRVHLGIR